MAAEVFAGLVGLLFVVGVFAAPIALLAGLYTGAIDIGFTSVSLSPDAATLPARVDLDPGEQPVVATSVDRSRWVPLAVVGVLTVFFVWGLALLVYAWRLRRRPQYVFTDERLVVEDPDGTSSHDLDSVGQVQTGTTVLESLVNRGHATFSIDRGTLVTIGYLSDPSTFAERVRDVVTDTDGDNDTQMSNQDAADTVQ